MDLQRGQSGLIINNTRDDTNKSVNKQAVSKANKTNTGLGNKQNPRTYMVPAGDKTYMVPEVHEGAPTPFQRSEPICASEDGPTVDFKSVWIFACFMRSTLYANCVQQMWH